MSEQPQSQRHRTEQDEPAHDEPTSPVPEHVIHPSAIVPDEHGNTFITFGDGTGAVHTAQGWIMVSEDDE
jgi:hypothetical protein